MAVLTLGWSILEGIGAALVLPAMAALIAGNFEGESRKGAYAVIGGVAGAGIAIGPILGGWATTELSWRVVFVGEVVLVLFILAMTRYVVDTPSEGRQAQARRRRLGAGRHRSRRSSCSARCSRAPGAGWPPRTPRSSRSGSRLTLFVIAGGGVLLLGLRPLAAASGGPRPGPAGPPRPAEDPAAALGPDRDALPEPHPHGDLLLDPALPADRPGPRRPRDRHQDAARLHRHVHHLGGRLPAVDPLHGALDRPGRALDHVRRRRRPAGHDRAHAGRRRLQGLDGPAGRRDGARSSPSSATSCSPRWTPRAGARPAACSTPASSWARRSASPSSGPSCSSD